MKQLKAKTSSFRQVEISKNELNQLIFWAQIGLTASKGGSYWGYIQETIKEYKSK